MQVSKEEILHIAKLADLSLSEEEVKKYQEQLQDILNFANIVNNANTEELEETISSNELYNVFRKDEILQEFSREELLQNAPDMQKGMFKIPKVIN